MLSFFNYESWITANDLWVILNEKFCDLLGIWMHTSLQNMIWGTPRTDIPLHAQNSKQYKFCDSKKCIAVHLGLIIMQAAARYYTLLHLCMACAFFKRDFYFNGLSYWDETRGWETITTSESFYIGYQIHNLYIYDIK